MPHTDGSGPQLHAESRHPLITNTLPGEADASTAVLALSAERDVFQTRLLEAWRDGWRACQAIQGDRYEAGHADGVLLRKRAEHGTVDLLRLELARWAVRGEARTRATFGHPHPADYPGRGEAA